MLISTFMGKTKGRIMSEAVRIFTEKGCSAARIRNISENAGMNFAFVNYYHQSKENLFAIISRSDSQQEFSATFRKCMQLVPQWMKQMPEPAR